jgi:uncharacterized membrane protein YjfL (UPF0719 family)
MDFFSSLQMDRYIYLILLVNISIAVGLFACLRIIAGVIANVNATDELAKRDNPAFGISLAGVLLGLAIMMTGAVSGSSHETLYGEIISVTGYGLLGVLLMSLTRFIFDKISMPQLSIGTEILKGNIAAAIVDAGNVLATAIIIRAVMIWVDTSSVEGMELVLAGYVVSQLILTLATFIRVKSYKNAQNGNSIQRAFQEGNAARSLSFSGYRIGIAFAITAASGMFPYEGTIVLMIEKWTVFALALMLIMSLLSWIANKLILLKIDVADEIDNQNNIAIGIIEGVTYVAVGMVLAGLLRS